MEIEFLRLEIICIQNVASLCIHCLQNVQKLWYSTDKTSIEKILSVKILYPSLEAGISEADISIRATNEAQVTYISLENSPKKARALIG